MTSVDRVILETTALARSGRTRGLGRYTGACLQAAEHIAGEVAPLQLELTGSSRCQEFSDVGRRTSRLARMPSGLFHATNAYVPAVTRRKTIVSILDVIPLDVRSHRQTGLKARAFHALARRADAILTISEFSAARIATLLDFPPERIFVAPLEPLSVFAEAGRDAESNIEAPAPYAFVVMDMASPDPRKRAFWIEKLAKRLDASGITLWVAGADTEKAFQDTPNVRALGRVSDARLASLYANSACFCYFSAYEGQGLPPLEAMAAGAPVVAMSNSAITEVVTGGGVLIDEPHDAWSADISPNQWMEATLDEMANYVVEYASDRKSRMNAVSRGRARAADFSWERFVDGTRAAYELVA